MEEWQLGPPLLVGDRVVHLGEVVRIIIIVLMPTDWCGKATYNVRGAPISDFRKKLGTIQFHKCNETLTTFDNGGDNTSVHGGH